MKWIAGVLTAAGLLFAALGCQSASMNKSAATQPAVAELPPVPDRLRAFYQDIQTGKFEILADLEQASQIQIFHVDGAASARITVRRSRIPTGAGALEVQMDRPDAILVVDGQTARDWTLLRDWSRYQLLMVSVYSQVSAVVNLQVRSGTDEPAWWVSEPKPLQPGWNLVRIDLGEAGRRINLTDVRQIRLTAKADSWPLTIYLDDMVLADNTTVAFGNPAGEPGSLYVLKKGQRYHVGAVGRFELVFNRGVLSNWYDLSNDPNRTIDLAGGGTVGPVLTALDEAGTPQGAIGVESWMGLGNAVQTHLQVVETNPLAVTIKGTVRFAGTPIESTSATPTPAPAAWEPADPPRIASTQEAEQELQALASQTVAVAGPAVAQQVQTTAKVASRPVPATQAAPSEHTYVYTVRQDGRVFVDIDATISNETFQPARIGLAVTGLSAVFRVKQVDPLDADLLSRMSNKTPGSRPVASDNMAASQPGDEDGSTKVPPKAPLPRALLLAGTRTGGANLLLAPCNVGLFERVVSATRQTGDIAAHMYVMNRPAGDHLRLAAMLAVWPPDLRDLPTATAIARDYQQPTPPRMEVGKLRTNSDGDLDGDGFAEASGRWIVEPDGQILRLRWPAGQLRFWPMLQVTGLSGKACWPYLDGRIIKPVQRKPDGNVEFVVPGILSRPALLEVTVEK